MTDQSRLLLYRSNRIEALLDCLVERLREAPPDPLTAECIVVQSKGMATWLGQNLADRLGVWANPNFPHPRRFIEDVLRAVVKPGLKSSVVSVSAKFSSPSSELTPGLFSRELLGLAVFELLPTLIGRREFTPLRRYLDNADDLKALQLAERIAYVFDQYAVYRPAMLMAWEEDAREIRETGDSHLFLSENSWQALLWRELVASLGSPVGLLSQAWQALLAGTLAAPQLLPQRVFLFGISALPPLYLSLLNELAKLIPCYLLVFSPTQDYWADINSPSALNRRLLRCEQAAISPEELHLAVGHPLLASLGKVGREFQELIEERAECLHPPDGDRFVDPELEAAGLLARLQGDIFALRLPQALDPPPPPTTSASPLNLAQTGAIADDSIVIHSCHSPLREVEVLQDQLLAILAEGHLTPRDIVVMTPDIELYAPFIEAVFSRPPQDRRYIPFRIVDRRINRQAPLLDALLALFELVRGRLPASRVLDFLAREPVRQGFKLDNDQLSRIVQWVNKCGIRWGIDEQDRKFHGQPADPQNTWRFGLDRLLVGYAVDGKGQDLVADILPHDDIEGQDSLSAGILLKFTTALFALAREVRTPRSPAHWAELIQDALVTFFAIGGGEERQKQILDEALIAVVRDGDQAGLSRTLELPAFLRLLNGRLNEAGISAGFLEGGLTFCTMLPMRAIPFAVVCLLGMNDGAFPRQESSAGFDLIAKGPRLLGDRCRRDDDRYLLLESLLAARQKLYISFVGRSLKDNRRLPPSVLVNELLDCLALMTKPPNPVGEAPEVESKESEEARESKEAERPQEPQTAQARFVVEHPLQPFSPRYFQDPAGPLFTFADQYAPRQIARPGRDQNDSKEPKGDDFALASPPFAPQELATSQEMGAEEIGDSHLLPGKTTRKGEIADSPPVMPFTRGAKSVLNLADLHLFFRNPSAWYARHCLGLTLPRAPRADETISEREPFFIDNLARYRIGALLLRRSESQSQAQGQAQGHERDATVLRLLRARGDLPLAGSAQPALEEISVALEPVAAFLASRPAGKALGPLTIDLDLGGGIYLTGELLQCFEAGLLRYTAAQNSPAFLLAAWLDHLALCSQAHANQGRQGRQCLMVSRAEQGADIYVFRELEATRARELLRVLALLWQRGQQAPLPFFGRSSYDYVYKMNYGQARDFDARDLAARQAASKAYHGDGYAHWPPPDGADPYVQVLFKDTDWLWPKREDLAPGGGPWDDFITVARQVYEPILQAREKLVL